MTKHVLDTILERADSMDPTFDADEVSRWPAGMLDRLVTLGLIKSDTHRQSVRCDACDESHQEEVVWAKDKKRRSRAYITCPEAGPVEVPADRLKCWMIDLDRLAELIVDGLSLTGKIREIVPGRTWRLGSEKGTGANRPYFFMRGLRWSDGAAVAKNTPCADSSIVFVPDLIPSPEVWSNAQPAIVALSMVSSLSQQGIEIDRAGIEVNLVKGSPPPRLTVDLENNAAMLDGKKYTVTPYQAYALSKLIEARGNWVTNDELKNEEGKPHRIDRILWGTPVSRGNKRSGLPKPIQDVIKSKQGTGYRITIFD